ncbi:MAG: glycosyltransferase family 2 protein [bacterium]|nr:glycosyltransferase family 2 protein [bacterium]
MIDIDKLRVLVSIIIPCRNEERFISKCLDSIIAQDYPKDKLKVLVIDGMSEDGTRETIQRYTQQYSNIKLWDNLKKIVPTAMNLGIKEAKGDVIIRMDAHTEYSEDYVSKCVRYLYEYNADNVGGTMVTLSQNDTFIGRIIVNVLTSQFGVGNSDFRTGTEQPKETDTVFGGCYRKEIFEKIGLFNEHLASSQDMEFNIRLKNNGGKIMLFPDIISYYYTRSDFQSFCKNNFRNGFWAIYPMKFVKMPLSWRHYIPFAFVFALLSLGMLSLYWWIFGELLLFTAGFYLLTNCFFSAKISISEKNWRYFPVLIFMFATLHLSYGLGSVVGLVKVLVSKNFWMMQNSRTVECLQG